MICERKSSNRNQAQSGRYTELQVALSKRREVGTLEISYSKCNLAHFRARPYFGPHRKRVRFAHLRSKKRSPKPQCIDFMGISDVSGTF